MQDETLTETLSLIDEEKPLPEGWQLVRLGDVCRVQGGFAFKSEDYLRSGNPIIRISNIQNGKVIVDAGTVFVKDSIVSNLENYKLNVGDVLMALSGATTGKIGKVSEGLENSYLNQRVGRFLPNDEKLDVSYLGLLYKSKRAFGKHFCKCVRFSYSKCKSIVSRKPSNSNSADD